jgi:hypothetical protein
MLSVLNGFEQPQDSELEKINNSAIRVTENPTKKNPNRIQRATLSILIICEKNMALEPP